MTETATPDAEKRTDTSASVGLCAASARVGTTAARALAQPDALGAAVAVVATAIRQPGIAAAGQPS
jgi:hypothetical protein